MVCGLQGKTSSNFRWYLVLQHFLTLVQGRHVLVRTDNRTTVAYINRQGRVRSTALLKIAENLLVWASEHLLSLRALHVCWMSDQRFGTGSGERKWTCPLWFSLTRLHMCQGQRCFTPFQ